MKRCKYCEQSHTLLGGCTGLEVYITERNLIFDVDGYHKETPINYCPICGRNLINRKVKL